MRGREEGLEGGGGVEGVSGECSLSVFEGGLLLFRIVEYFIRECVDSTPWFMHSDCDVLVFQKRPQLSSNFKQRSRGLCLNERVSPGWMSLLSSPLAEIRSGYQSIL